MMRMSHAQQGMATLMIERSRARPGAAAMSPQTQGRPNERTQKCVVLGPVGLFHSAVRRCPSVTDCLAAAMLLLLPLRYCR